MSDFINQNNLTIDEFEDNIVFTGKEKKPLTIDEFDAQIEFTNVKAVRDQTQQVFDYLVGMSENPKNEKLRLAGSSYLSDVLNLPTEYTYENFDNLVNIWTGGEYGAETWWESIRNSWKAGTLQTKINDIRYRESLGEISEEQAKPLITELKKQLPTKDITRQAMPVQAISAVAEQLPLWKKGLVDNFPEAIAAGAGAAGAALLLGQAGPQVLAPEEILTVPGAFFAGVGAYLTAGTAVTSYKQMAGGFYDQMMDYEEQINAQLPEGTDRQTLNRGALKIAAHSVGAISGIIETMQIGQIPGVDTLLKKAATKVATSPKIYGKLSGVVLKAGGRYAKFIGQQEAEELAQETVSIVGEEILKEWTNETEGTEFEGIKLDDALLRYKNVVVQTALASAALGAPGITIQTVSDVNKTVKQQKYQEGIKGFQDKVTGVNQNLKEDIETKQEIKPLDEIKYLLNTEPVDGVDENVTFKTTFTNTKNEKSGVVYYRTDQDGAIIVDEITATDVTTGRDLIRELNNELDSPISFGNEAVRNRYANGFTTEKDISQVEELRAKGETSKLKTTDIDTLRQNIKYSFTEFKNEEIDVAISLIDARAEKMGIDSNEWVRTFINEDAFIKNVDLGEDTRKAAISFLNDGKAVFMLTQKADFTSWVHEMGHVIRRQLDNKELKNVQDWLGINEYKEWYTDKGIKAEERFAVGLEQYIKDGEVENTKVKGALEKIKDWIQELYLDMKDILPLSKDQKKIYDNLFSNDEAVEIKTDQGIPITPEVKPEEKTGIRNVLFQDLEDDIFNQLKEEAKAYNSWQEFKKFAEAMGVEGETIFEETEKRTDTFYKELWEEAQREDEQVTLETQEIKTREQANEDFIREISNKETMQAFLRDLSGVIRKGDKYHPSIYTNALRAKAGVPMTDRGFAIVRGIMAKNAESYRALMASLYQDEAMIRQLQEEQAADEAGGENRFDLVESLETQEEKERVFAGDVTIDQINQEYKEALESARQEAALQTKEATKEGKEAQKQIEKRRKDKKLIRNRMKQLANRITRNIGKSVNLEQRKIVEEIQKDIDPNFRTKKTLQRRGWIDQIIQKGGNELEYLQTLFSKEELKNAGKKSLNDFSMKELEKLSSFVDAVKKEGRQIKQLQDERIREGRRIIVDAMEESIRERKTKYPIGGFGQQQLNIVDKALSALTDLNLDLKNTINFVETLQGGKEEGIFKEQFIRRVNQSEDNKIRQINSIIKKITDKQKELGVSNKEMLKKVKTGIPGKETSIQDAMYIYLGMQNQKTREALVFGNLGQYTETEALQIIENITSQLEDKHKSFVEFLSNEIYDKELYPLFKNAYENDTNIELGKEVAYLPMFRTDFDGKVGDNTTIQEIMEEYGVKRAYANKDRAKQRQNIRPNNQKPIRTDLLPIMYKSLNQMSHYINYWETIKDLQYFVSNEKVKTGIKETLGDKYYNATQKYVNDIASYNQSKDVGGIANIIRRVQGNASSLYLGYKAVTALTQLGAIGQMSFYSSPIGVMRGVARFISNPIEISKMIDEKAPQIKESSIDPILRELMQDQQIKAENVFNKIKEAGFIGIKEFDKLVKRLGYMMVLETELARNPGNTDLAHNRALEAVTRSQPTGRVKDLPQILRQPGNGGAFIKAAFMFQSQMFQIWNQLAYEVPRAVKRGQFVRSFALLTGVGLMSMYESFIRNRLEPAEDKDELIEWISQGMIEYIPGAGGAIAEGITGYSWRKHPAHQFFHNIGDIIGDVKEGEYLEALQDAAFTGAGLGAGAPIKGLERFKDAFEKQDILELISAKR